MAKMVEQVSQDGFKHISPMGKAVSVCGYEVRRCPIGRMLAALEIVSNIPAELTKAWLSVVSLDKLVSGMSGNAQDLFMVVSTALSYFPGAVMGIISKLTDIPLDCLTDDENIGPLGILEILGAWCEVNELENFTGAVRLILSMRAGGFTGSSRPDYLSGLASESYSRISTLGRLVRCLTPGPT